MADYVDGFTAICKHYWYEGILRGAELMKKNPNNYADILIKCNEGIEEAEKESKEFWKNTGKESVDD